MWSCLRVWHRTPPEVRIHWRGTTNCHTWVALYGDGGLIGAGGLTTYRSLPFCGPGFVLEQHRGNGYQVALLLGRVLYAKRQGWEVLTTCVDPRNVPSIKNVQRAGFAQTGAIAGLLYFQMELAD